VQAFEGVAARGEQLEAHHHERRAHSVDRYRADLAALVDLADVEIADRSLANGSAVPRLLAHLVANVFAIGL
jgi:hypothetical protein